MDAAYLPLVLANSGLAQVAQLIEVPRREARARVVQLLVELREADARDAHVRLNCVLVLLRALPQGANEVVAVLGGPIVVHEQALVAVMLVVEVAVELLFVDIEVVVEDLHGRFKVRSKVRVERFVVHNIGRVSAHFPCLFPIPHAFLL